MNISNSGALEISKLENVLVPAARKANRVLHAVDAGGENNFNNNAADQKSTCRFFLGNLASLHLNDNF